MKQKNIISLAFYFFVLSFSNVLALPSCPSSGYFDNCSGSDFLPDGSKYIGEYKQNEPHGEGILTKPNGDKYVGEWNNGDQEGQGTFFYSNGDKYVGQWSANKPNGQGTFIWGTNTEFSGYKYLGQFKDNNREGQGVMTYPDGSKYIGQWSDNKFNGQGTFIWGKNTEFSGYKFIGQYKDDKRDGLGVMTYSDGAKYDGNWKNNDRSGYGTYTFSDGRKYVGEWDRGKYQGLGKLFHSDGSINKEGFFKNNEFVNSEIKALPNCPPSGYFHNCFGIYIKANGDKYVGEFENNEYNGQGTLTFANGDKYVGVFKDDEPNGKGTYTCGPNGSLPDCPLTLVIHDNSQTSTGKVSLQVTLSKPNGDKYIGELKNGKKSGFGTYTWVDGKKYVGEYKDGLFHGQGTATYPNGVVKTGSWFKGKLIQEKTITSTYNENNEGISEVPRIEDILNAIYGSTALRQLYSVDILKLDGFFQNEKVYTVEVKYKIDEHPLSDRIRERIFRDHFMENGMTKSEAISSANLLGLYDSINSFANVFSWGQSGAKINKNKSRIQTDIFRFGKGGKRWIYLPETVSGNTSYGSTSNETNYKTPLQDWVKKYGYAD